MQEITELMIVLGDFHCNIVKYFLPRAWFSPVAENVTLLLRVQNGALRTQNAII